MNEGLQRRFTSKTAGGVKLQTRADGALPLIVGYAAVFYREGDPGTEFELWPGVVERIMPGSFDRALGEDDTRALFNHETGAVLGRKSSKTLRLSVDERGLRYEIDPPDTTLARDLITSIQRGDISGSSFAFVPRATEWRDSDDRKTTYLHRTDMALFDVGPVTYPAYSGTDAGVRTAAGDLTGDRVKWEKRNAARDLAALDLLALEMLLSEIGT